MKSVQPVKILIPVAVRDELNTHKGGSAGQEMAKSARAIFEWMNDECKKGFLVYQDGRRECFCAKKRDSARQCACQARCMPLLRV